MSVSVATYNNIQQMIGAGKTTLYLQTQPGFTDGCVNFYIPCLGAESNLGTLSGELIGSSGNPWDGSPQDAYIDCDTCTSPEEHPCPVIENYLIRKVLYGSSCSETELDFIATSNIGAVNTGDYVKVVENNDCYIVISTTSSTPTLTIESQSVSCEICNTGVVSMTEVTDFNNCTGPAPTYFGDISGLGSAPQVNEFVKGSNLTCYIVTGYVNNSPTITLTGGPWSGCNSCGA